MSDRRIPKPKLSLRGPVILFVIVLVLTVALAILWNVVLVHDYQKLKALTAQDSTFHWTFVALGTALFVTILVLSIILGAMLFEHIRWRQKQSDFLASVSHELNSPLSSIKLFAQTLRSPDLAETDRRSFVQKILFDVERLQRLIGNILRAAEIDGKAETLRITPQDSDLAAILRSFAQDARVLHADSRLEIDVEAPAVLSAFVDRIMIRQVLDNLVDNAIRYAGEGPPTVTLRGREAGDWVVLEVADRGIGIPTEDLPRLFDRFYRVVSERVDGGAVARRGTGIGLFVVRSIVEAHGGQVAIASDGPGRGATLRARLPASRWKDRAA